MKVKLFIRGKSSFRSWRKHNQEFDHETNTWLAAHPGIRSLLSSAPSSVSIAANSVRDTATSKQGCSTETIIVRVA